MPALHKRLWTAEEVYRLIENNPLLTPRYELIDGELLVTPSPGGMHQRIVFELALLLTAYVRRQKLGEVRLGPSPFELEKGRILQPDIFIVPGVAGRRPRATDAVTRLLLAVEVLSPGSVRFDRVKKRRHYQQRDVPEYWVVDPDGQTFERWRPGDERAELIAERLTWHPSGASEAFTFDVQAFFADALDDVEE